MGSGIGSILELALRTSSCLAYVLNRRDLENRLWLCFGVGILECVHEGTNGT